MKLIENKGIHELDPKSKEGIWAKKWFEEIDAASNQKIAGPIRALSIEKVIESMLIARSAFTFLSVIRMPSSGVGETAEAKVKAYNAANAAWRGAVNVTLKYLQFLGVKEDDGKNKGTESWRSQLLKDVPEET